MKYKENAAYYSINVLVQFKKNTSSYVVLYKGNITKMPRITALLYLYSSRKIPAAMWFLKNEILRKCRVLQHKCISTVQEKYQQLCGSL